MGQSIGRAHSRARDMKEVKIKVLKEHHPMGFVVREFLRLAEVSQVLVISEESDRVRGSL